MILQIFFAFILLVIARAFFAGRYCRIVGVDLTGRIAIITGGNDGIGRQTALRLAKLKCTVIIASRNRLRSEETVKHIIATTHNQNVEYYELDLSSKRSVQDFASEIRRKYTKVDILVNNAGMVKKGQKTMTKDGFEYHLAVNHLGHFYLTSLLYDHLLQSDRLRIVNVSALAHVFVKDIDFNKDINFEITEFSSIKAYSRTKLYNILFSKRLAARIERVNENARVTSLHPGVFRSGFGKQYLAGPRLILYYLSYPLLLLILKNNIQGAQTTLHCILEESARLKNGGYYSDCSLKSTSNLVTPENSEALWTRSEELLNSRFYA